MSIDTTFKPATQTTLVGLTAAQVGGPGGTATLQSGVTTFRIHNILAAAAVLGYGPSAATAVATPAAANAPAFAITIAAGAVVYLELPSPTFFIASAASAFEITGGIGGCGGNG
jgi:hypothetical protein